MRFGLGEHNVRMTSYFRSYPSLLSSCGLARGHPPFRKGSPHGPGGALSDYLIAVDRKELDNQRNA